MITHNQITVEQIDEALSTEHKDEITGKEELIIDDSDFASPEDISDIINEEIEQKQEWAQANACRAYIDSTF